MQLIQHRVLLWVDLVHCASEKVDRVTIKSGQEKKLTLVGIRPDGSEEPIEFSSWVTENYDIATVDSGGYVKGYDPGVIQLSVSEGECPSSNCNNRDSVTSRFCNIFMNEKNQFELQ